jgi:glycosyltransferase involved in cell wall biosynthesis
VPMQAGCFGLPAIVTDINGCNEIIQDEVNGLIVPPKQTGPLERAMERMVVDTGLRERCAAASRPSIVQRYQQAHVWASLYDEYRRLLLAGRVK